MSADLQGGIMNGQTRDLLGSTLPIRQAAFLEHNMSAGWWDILTAQLMTVIQPVKLRELPMSEGLLDRMATMIVLGGAVSISMAQSQNAIQLAVLPE